MPLLNENDTWWIALISTLSLIWGCHWSMNIHACSHCNLILLTGKKPGFCCGPHGKYLSLLPQLPPLPVEYENLLHDPRISTLSCSLNLLFSFASMETTEKFTSDFGGHGFVAIQGKVYHWICPSHNNTIIQWILYDGFLCTLAPHLNWASIIPSEWIEAITSALLQINPFVWALSFLGQLPLTFCPPINITLEDPGTASELLQS